MRRVAHLPPKQQQWMHHLAREAAVASLCKGTIQVQSYSKYDGVCLSVFTPHEGRSGRRTGSQSESEPSARLQ